MSMKKELLIIGLLFLAALVAAIAFWPRIQDTPPATEAEPVAAEAEPMAEERDTPGIPPTAEAEDFQAILIAGVGSAHSWRYSFNPKLIAAIWDKMRPELWGDHLPNHSLSLGPYTYINFDGYSAATEGSFLIDGDYIAFLPGSARGIVTWPSWADLEDEDYNFYQLPPDTHAAIEYIASFYPLQEYDQETYGSEVTQWRLDQLSQGE